MLFLSIVFLIPILIFFSFFLMKFMNLKMKEKFSPFECGFDPFSFSRVPFSLKFFFIGIIFLIFDAEIVLILPFPILFNKSISFLISFSILNLIILFGLIFEWKSGMIEWLN
uniref:NADH dehydrogenase subunit 3 n=1 Tax=Amblyomma papuanum TaxID=3065601 RepID=UPI0030FF2397